MNITAMAPWFGSKRILAAEIVRQLGPHRTYWEPFCGSMAVLLNKPPAAMETVCDLHESLTNLAWVLQSDKEAPILYEMLARTLYSDVLFAKAKERWNVGQYDSRVQRAYDYFICSWMGRNGVSGTHRINYQQAIRWTGRGGSGPTRFTSAVESIPAWHERLRKVCIICRDAFDVIPKIEDDPGVAIYLDPPYFPETRSQNHGSSRYVHEFTEADHVRLAEMARRFKKARVVVSYYDSPRLDALYPGFFKVTYEVQKKLCARQNRRGEIAVCTDAAEVLMINGFPAKESKELFY